MRYMPFVGGVMLLLSTPSRRILGIQENSLVRSTRDAVVRDLEGKQVHTFEHCLLLVASTTIYKILSCLNIDSFESQLFNIFHIIIL